MIGEGEKEKRAVALSSVLAGAALTGGKIAVGVLTGSLGILSEAAHSALDFLAAFITYLAVRASSKPADAEHHYGHGKIENFSALVETLLLLLTAGWVISEAVHRLIREETDVEASLTAFLVMGGSIVVDFSRSRALKRAAKKYASQALEADALHFETDIWSSAVVIVGLIFVALAEHFNYALLKLADPIAALGVSGLIVWVSISLGRRTVDVLLDRAPAGLTRQVIAAVRSIPGVREVRHVRLRTGGHTIFVDVFLALARETSLDEAQATIKHASDRIAVSVPFADITVHVAPDTTRPEEAVDTVRRIAHQHSTAAHRVAAFESDGRLFIELHLEVNADLTLDEGHEVATAIEERIRADIPNVADVVSHIEGARPAEESWRLAPPGWSGEEALRTAVAKFPEVRGCDGIRVWTQPGRVALSCRMTFDGALKVVAAHEIAHRVEQSVRCAIPDIERVTIHCEPGPAGTASAARAAKAPS